MDRATRYVSWNLLHISCTKKDIGNTAKFSKPIQMKFGMI